MLQHGADDLRLVAVALDEERADRPVDQAGDQRLLLGRATFPLEIATGNAAGGEGLFLVVHGQREEIDPRLRRFGGDDGREHDGLAIGGEHGGVGLAGDLAGLEHELAPAPHQFFGLDIEHGFSFGSDATRLRVSSPWARRRSARFRTVTIRARALGDPAMGERRPAGHAAGRPMRLLRWRGACAAPLRRTPLTKAPGAEPHRALASAVDQRRMPSFSISER